MSVHEAHNSVDPNGLGGGPPLTNSNPGDPNSNINKIFVGGLPPQTTNETLKEAFEMNFGPVQQALVMEFFDKIQGVKRSRGFGFVTFENSVALDAAVGAHHIEVDGKTCEVKRIDEGKSSIEGKAEIEGRKIFCGGLADTVDNEKLKSFFRAVDPDVIESKVMMDPQTGRSRCFGYVTFSAKEFVERAVAQRESNYIDGKWVDVKPCTVGKGDKGKGKGMGKGKGKGKGWEMGIPGAVSAYGAVTPGYPSPYDPYGYAAAAAAQQQAAVAIPGYYPPVMMAAAAYPAAAGGAAAAYPGYDPAVAHAHAQAAYAVAQPAYPGATTAGAAPVPAYGVAPPGVYAYGQRVARPTPY